MSQDTSPLAGSELARPAEPLPAATVNWPRNLEMVAEQLAQALADQLGQIVARRGPLDEARIQAYEITRRQLAGPSDDEADTLSLASIVSVYPTPVTVGTTMTVTVRNAGQVDEIVFASSDGTVATKDFTQLGRRQNSHDTDQSVAVLVPQEAITGPLSAVTNAGILTFRKNIYITSGTSDSQGASR
jgi:hypothetical protein